MADSMFCPSVPLTPEVTALINQRLKSSKIDDSNLRTSDWSTVFLLAFIDDLRKSKWLSEFAYRMPDSV